MSFSAPQAPTPPLPTAPPAPPNPPLFGSSATKSAGARQRSQAGTAQGFGGTILGNTNPTNTASKTLLGQ